MKVKFLTAIQHDADSYQEGETADLSASAAKALIDCGAAEEASSSRTRAQAESAEKAAADKAGQ